jgi:hypothetical protein
MKCSACGLYAPFEDGFCSACGVEMPESRLPAKRDPSPLPTVWQQAAPVVARGVALVVVGIAAELLMRTFANSALGSRSQNARPSKKSRDLVKPQTALIEEVVAVSRTVVTRRVVVRR